MNLTGLVYLGDGTPLSATQWANNTSFAVYLDHGNDWSAAWRYPPWPLWYTTSMGAYSIVLPAIEKEMNWSNGDWYRVQVDASEVFGRPGTLLNATSNGTGDPGEFTPSGYLNNSIVWSATDNWQRWDVVVTGANLAPNAVAFGATEFPGPYTPGVSLGPVTVQTGEVFTVSANVTNSGLTDATNPTTFTFYDVSTSTLLGQGSLPAIPAGSTRPSGWRFNASWTAPPGAGDRFIDVIADYYGNVTETREDDNTVRLWIHVVVPGMPDFVPANPQPPSPLRIGVGMTTSLSVQVRNVGAGNASIATVLAFYNETTPGSPFHVTDVPPLDRLQASGSYAAQWIAPGSPGTRVVVATVDYSGILPEENETNNSYTWTIDVLTGPVTSLVIGNPNYTATMTYVKSSTSIDFSVIDQSGQGILNTTYRVDGGDWINYTATGRFYLTGEGDHSIDWYSVDRAGNVEEVASMLLRVDDTPPVTAISIGEPKYLTGGTYVNSSTPLALSAVDGGVGSNSTFYRLWDGTWTLWREYSSSLSLAGRDGAWYVEFLSFDYLGNMEVVQNETLILDDTPPVTTISPAAPFTLAAADSGCGVNVTMYRIDGGNWTVYTGGFILAEGEHTIYYYSIDNLGNVEQEKSLVVKPPPEVAVNYKPLVALVFAIILLVAGIWSSKRRPWKGGKDRMAVMKAFTFTSMPFVLAEAATGLVSLLTGQLSIPPPVGPGTALDLAILVAGLAVQGFTVFRPGRSPVQSA
jgi:hypothetical protein